MERCREVKTDAQACLANLFQVPILQEGAQVDKFVGVLAPDRVELDSRDRSLVSF